MHARSSMAASADSFRVYLGAGLCESAVVLIAIGANIQRYALDRISPARRICNIVSARSLLWLCGLSVYFTANVIYTIALVFAPASLCATLMATIVPINALTSRLILGEKLQLVDIQGGLAITGGICLAAYAAPYTNDEYDAEQLQRLFFAPDSVWLLLAQISAVLTLAVIVLAHESECCCAPACLSPAMPFAYPVVIGLLESLVQTAQKGGSSLLAQTLGGGASPIDSDGIFWYVMGAWGLTSLLVVWWLRKGLSMIEASRLLPIEYGTFTASSVVAGLVVYDEAQYVSKPHRVLMTIGVVLVALGCAFVGSRRALRCEVRWTSDSAEAEEAAAREASLRETLLYPPQGNGKRQQQQKYAKPQQQQAVPHGLQLH